ncbi:WAP four-disulfide core domain protein 5-like isoform X2 [Rana temporaria]|uniref:WAP four-disulfide core domain protein 5-like n=1 Tax=Rana temporaria TaxID=8407 RepID=UPI001AAD823C|nr:WAP four-disulfide core domain protein 5-like [Rana temporaria]XP_040203995.1 WAP four-disulfide core domain protein 5-like isoform X2 [Rana temporaria]
MSPETGSLLLLLLICAGATALIPSTANLTDDKELLGRQPPGKPGRCPADVEFNVDGSTLQNECRRDGHCEGKMKCCFSGGRRQCLLPLDVKNNACPNSDDSVCIATIYAQLCQRDDQCQGTDRCCSFKCRAQCTPTVTVKPGSCLPTCAKCSFTRPKPKCNSDSDCKGKKKCCTTWCGMECTDPWSPKDDFLEEV